MFEDKNESFIQNTADTKLSFILIWQICISSYMLLLYISRANVWFQKISIPPHGWFLSFYPPAPWNIPSRGSFVDPPPQKNFQFFLEGLFLKLAAFLSLNKSENTSFTFTLPFLIICCMHYNNISKIMQCSLEIN